MIPFHARRWRVLATSLFLVSNILPAAAAPVAAAGTIGIAGFGDPYTQDFDTLAASATSASSRRWDFAEAAPTPTHLQRGHRQRQHRRHVQLRCRRQPRASLRRPPERVVDPHDRGGARERHRGHDHLARDRVHG